MLMHSSSLICLFMLEKVQLRTHLNSLSSFLRPVDVRRAAGLPQETSSCILIARSPAWLPKGGTVS